MSTTPGPFLFRAEVKGIQAWILASDRLRELLGGSAVIEGLCSKTTKKDALPEELSDVERLVQATGGSLETAAAGNIELRFGERSELERFAAAWPLVVAERAPGLQVIQAWAPVQGSEPAARDTMFKALVAARNDIDAELPEVGPLVARAGRTGLPAVRTGEKDGLEDRVVQAKLLAADRQRRGGGMDRLAPEGRSFVTEADDLGERYLALIHADGNGLGEQFKKAQGPARLKASRLLAEACEEAAKAAVALLVRLQDTEDEAEGPADERPQLHARPIVVGGDDFTLLVDAQFALPVAARFLEAFDACTSRLNPFGDGVPLTACAGIALVKTGFPFHTAHNLAESLCTSAKVRLRASGGKPARSGLLFHRVTTASTELRWSQIEELELSARVGDTEGRLSAGPYTLHELRLLSDLASKMRPLPRGAMRQWLSLSRSSDTRARALWERTREVARPEDWKKFEAALHALGQARFGATPDGGWFADEQLRRSPIGEALLWRSLQPRDANRYAPGQAPTETP